MLMEALPVLAAESVTRAVIVCVPLLNDREKLPPFPITPSMLEVQTSFEVKLPSRRSEAFPEKLMIAPEAKAEPFAGLVIVTVGGVPDRTLMLTELEVVLPAESVTRAVMAWVPLLKVREKLPPVPIWPLRLDVQTSLLVKLPS